MAKKLRLDVAELTDIGRRRSNNQDNLARRIPDNQTELDDYGALIVVADGMGGHAAGEIASTVAVQTISATYGDVLDEEVLKRLAAAIKKANESILSIARENAEHTGMGTTMVAAVVSQGILYVANIGDSRAYIVRKGRLRQLTEDHSWVAEQVRAGVLTEEQAKTHVHRNVITRSLGTQPNVVADVFVEQVREDDRILLCSDGLHGYVTDALIEQTLLAYDPTVAAKRLIELANDAGGPDNITVSVMHVLETPEAPPDLLEKLQLLNDQPRQTRPMPIVASPAEKQPIAAPTPPEPLRQTDKVIAAAPIRQLHPIRNNLLRIVAVILVIGIASGIWYITIGPYAQAQTIANKVTRDIQHTKSDIAPSLLSSFSPAQQLAILAADQDTLNKDLLLAITKDQRDQLLSTLDSIAPVARKTLSDYNILAKVTPLSEAGAATSGVACGDSLLGNLIAVSLFPPPTPPLPAGTPPPTIPTPAPVSTAYLLALDKTNHVVQLATNAAQTSCTTTSLTDTAALAGTGNSFATLATPTTGPATVNIIDSTSLQPSASLSLSALPDGIKPTLLAYNGSVIAVGIHTNAGDRIYLYDNVKADPTKPVILSPTHTLRSLSFGGNGLLYVLDNTGTLGTYRPGASSSEIHPVGGLQIPDVLGIGNPATYTIATPLPTVTIQTQGAILTGKQVTLAKTLLYMLFPAFAPFADGTVTPAPSPTPVPPTATPSPQPISTPSTILATALTLAADAETTPYVIVNDVKSHRIIVLRSSGVDLTLVHQYSATTDIDKTVSVSVSPDGQTIYILSNTILYQLTQTNP